MLHLEVIAENDQSTVSFGKRLGVVIGEIAAKTKAQLRDKHDKAKELAEVKASGKADVDAHKKTRKERLL